MFASLPYDLTDGMTETKNQTAVETTGTILVTGGTGKIGRHVASRLTAAGFSVRAASRSTETPFDWHDRSTWTPALEGVTAAFLMYTPDIGDPRAGDILASFSKLAVEQGVQRLVLLSARGEDQAAPAEDAVRNSGAEWTILQAAWFNQNFNEGVFADMVRGGQVFFLADEVLEPFVDADDLAAVAVTALTESGHASQNYELTGPRLLTFGDAVDTIARESGHNVVYIPITGDQFTAPLKADYGMSDEEVAGMLDIFTTLIDGRNAKVTDTLEQLLGRTPVDFEDFVRNAVASGAWK
jgi:uncharacterized protein YbjT (DUF2867 family)